MQHKNMHGIESKRVQMCWQPNDAKYWGKDEMLEIIWLCVRDAVFCFYKQTKERKKEAEIKRCTCEDTHAH